MQFRSKPKFDKIVIHLYLMACKMQVAIISKVI